MNIEAAQKVLSQKDLEEVFRIATKGLVHFHGSKFADGMTDKELEDAWFQVLVSLVVLVALIACLFPTMGQD